MSREYTLEEMQEQFIGHIHALIDYWENESRASTTKEKLEGLAFSILTAIDGESLAVPGYQLIPVTSEENKEYYISQGENYYPEDTDIAGYLHEKFYQFKE